MGETNGAKVMNRRGFLTSILAVPLTYLIGTLPEKSRCQTHAEMRYKELQNRKTFVCPNGDIVEYIPIQDEMISESASNYYSETCFSSDPPHVEMFMCCDNRDYVEYLRAPWSY